MTLLFLANFFLLLFRPIKKSDRAFVCHFYYVSHKNRVLVFERLKLVAKFIFVKAHLQELACDETVFHVKYWFVLFFFIAKTVFFFLCYIQFSIENIKIAFSMNMTLENFFIQIAPVQFKTKSD